MGTEPDLMVVLWEEALRTRVVSSVGVRSAMESKWRGAKGEVAGVAGEEYVRLRIWRGVVELPERGGAELLKAS